jgi:hypothetical protein
MFTHLVPLTGITHNDIIWKKFIYQDDYSTLMLLLFRFDPLAKSNKKLIDVV